MTHKNFAHLTTIFSDQSEFWWSRGLCDHAVVMPNQSHSITPVNTPLVGVLLQLHDLIVPLATHHGPLMSGRGTMRSCSTNIAIDPKKLRLLWVAMYDVPLQGFARALVEKSFFMGLRETEGVDLPKNRMVVVQEHTVGETLSLDSPLWKRGVGGIVRSFPATTPSSVGIRTNTVM